MSPSEARTSLDHAIDRASLHNDPIAPVLTALSDTLLALEHVESRLHDPIPNETIDRICRAAALGANARVVDMIRTTDRRGWWIRASWWLASVLAAGVAGYALGAGLLLR